MKSHFNLRRCSLAASLFANDQLEVAAGRAAERVEEEERHRPYREVQVGVGSARSVFSRDSSARVCGCSPRAGHLIIPPTTERRFP